MLNGMKSIKVGKLLKLTHEDLLKMDVIPTVKNMQKELGYKCVNSSYYLNDAMESIKKSINIAMRNNEAITEDSELWLHDEWVMTGEGIDEVEVTMLTHTYHEMLFNAILNVGGHR